ncbi:hypothetical protein ES708_23671 [subsurface metagenome]
MITDYRLQITDYRYEIKIGLQMSDYRCEIKNRIADNRLQI